MVDNKITKARVKHHFTYSAWKYVLLVALSIIAWDLIYNMKMCIRDSLYRIVSAAFPRSCSTPR